MTDIIPQPKHNRISGVYEIVNAVNGHRYIGSSVNVHRRWGLHLHQLRKENHHSSYLQRAWNKYGEDCFKFAVIENCDKDRLLEREQFFIDTTKPSYNILPTAGNQLGAKHTEERRARNSISHKGQVPWNKGIQGQTAWNKGITHSAETRLIISIKAKGRTPWNKGGSSWCKGKSFSEEHRRKIGDAERGKLVSEETRAKIGAKSKGRLFSEEARRKMSESHKKRWEEKRLANKSAA